MRWRITMAPPVMKPPRPKYSLPATAVILCDNDVHANWYWAQAAFDRGQRKRPHSQSAGKVYMAPLNITLQGWTYSSQINLSGVQRFQGSCRRDSDGARYDTAGTAAVTTGDLITPETVSFTGTINHASLQVTSISSGTLRIGAQISGFGIKPGSEIILRKRCESLAALELHVFSPSSGTYEGPITAS